MQARAKAAHALDTPAERDAATALYTELLLEQLEVSCSSGRGFEIQDKLDEIDQEAERRGLEFDVENSKIVLRRTSSNGAILTRL